MKAVFVSPDEAAALVLAGGYIEHFLGFRFLATPDVVREQWKARLIARLERERKERQE